LKGASAACHVDGWRTVGQAHRVGHRHEHFARSLEALSPMRSADVVHQEQVPALPPLAGRVLLIHLIDQVYDVRADGVAVAKAGMEGQPVLAVDVYEVLAQLRVRPLVQECDLVEPAPLPCARMTHDSASPLPSAKPTI